MRARLARSGAAAVAAAAAFSAQAARADPAPRAAPAASSSSSSSVAASSPSPVAGALPGERLLNGPQFLAMLRAPDGLLSRLGLLEGHFVYSSLRRGPAAPLEQYDLLLAPDGASLRALVVLGARACGHPRLVHGGALAAVLDDAYGTLFMHCGLGSGFTANLSVDYVRPVPAGARLEVLVRVDRVERSSSGRSNKVFMEATVTERREDGEGGAAGADAVAPGKDRVFARSSALFVAKRSVLPSAEDFVSGVWRMMT
jgi:acyl-coenzyme A thioesterase PaaI-like protein